MFDSTVVSNRFNYNINAVSGTVRKSHPKSKFVIRKLEGDMLIFSCERPRLTKYDDEIVILQIMLIGNNSGLVEYVLKKDFEEAGAE